MSGTRRRPGRMGPHIEGFEARLLELGYTPGTVRGLLKGVGQLGRWMAAEEVETGLVAEAAIEAFLAARGRGGHRRVPSLRSFAPLLDYLRSQALIVPVAGVPSTPVDGRGRL